MDTIVGRRAARVRCVEEVCRVSFRRRSYVYDQVCILVRHERRRRHRPLHGCLDARHVLGDGLLEVGYRRLLHRRLDGLHMLWCA